MSLCPGPYPREFRDDVVRVARNRDDEVTIEQIATDFGIHPDPAGSAPWRMAFTQPALHGANVQTPVCLGWPPPARQSSQSATDLVAA